MTVQGAGARDPTLPKRACNWAQRGGAGQRQYPPLPGVDRPEKAQHFVTTASPASRHCRAHRYVLASVEIECEESDEHRELLRKFMGEFKPERVSNTSPRVIAGLRITSAPRLVAFAGLNAAQPADSSSDEAQRYGGLLAELRRGSPEVRAPVS